MPSSTTNTTTTTTVTTLTLNTVTSTTTANNNASTPITWSEQEIRLLVDQRQNRNTEYHQILGRSRRSFWNSVARRINRAAGSNFSGRQCKRKFQNLVSIYYVSKNNII